MNKIFKLFFSLFFWPSIMYANSSGKNVFETYCWGCHHQTSVAFGPSFQQIANTRTKSTIMSHILSPKSMYKQLGYKRSVMPSFANTLSDDELELITEFILSYKGVK
jgi:mono/diheme cytochrome c family protein